MFASKCQGECHAVKAALCDLGDPGWGIPSFRIELCCFLHPLKWPMVILWFFLLLFCVMGLPNMTHKLSSACAEMIPSYHLLPQQIFFTHKLDPVTSLLCGCVVVCLLCGLFLFVFVFGVVFAFGPLGFGSCSLERDKGIGLCIGPLPVYFCGPTASAPA